VSGLPSIFWFACYGAAIGLPLLAAALLLAGRARSCMVRVAPWLALPAIPAVIPAVSPPTLTLTPLLLRMELGVDPVSRAFLLFTALLWWISGLYAQRYLAPASRPRFFAFYLPALAGNIGLLLARDIASFFALFALMSFASYGLVVHSGRKEAREAGRVYLILVVVGEALLFPALLMGFHVTQAFEISTWVSGIPASPRSGWIVGLLLLAFGIKAGSLPLHVWLPLAHPAAPTPASAVLSGAMIKAGLYGLIRFLPLGQWSMPQWGALVQVLSLVACLGALAAALTQNNPKTLLAYSSIGKMGLMTFAVGCAMVEPSLWTSAQVAVVAFALHHGLTKGALFLSVGILPRLPASRRLRAFCIGAGVVPLLVFAGLPLTGGAVAKLPFKSLADALDPEWALALKLSLNLVIGGSVVLLWRFASLLWKESRTTPAEPDSALTWSWLGGACLALISPALLAGLGFGYLASGSLKTSVLVSGVWPLLMGLVLAWIWSRRGFGGPVVPAGDLLHLYRWVGNRLRVATPGWLTRFASRQAGSSQAAAVAVYRQVKRALDAEPWLRRTARLELEFRDGSLAGGLLLLLLLLIVGTLAW